MARKEAVRVFLDSNVIISGIISDKGAPRIILDLLSLRLPFLAGFTGEYNLIEIERNIHRKIPAALPVYREYLPRMNLDVVPLPSAEQVKKAKWKMPAKDIPVALSAVNGKADYLVTGDKKDFTTFRAKGIHRFKVASPAQFVDDELPRIIKDFAG
ncbi:MAG: PIN domain-containing protein [Nitrospinae bacterium]|nr:PIN domain-containing protein [Nitrospinota bacterium]